VKPYFVYHSQRVQNPKEEDMSKSIRIGFIFSMVAAFIICGAGNLLAGTVENASDKVSVRVYGQVNRAITSVNDGDENYVNHVDNDNSSTRFGFKVKAKGSDSLAAGANLEWEYQANESNKVSQVTHSTDPGLAKRKLEVYLDTVAGKFSIGHGPTASDGTSEVDLSGSTVAGYSLIDAWAGGIQFYDEASRSLSGTTVGSVMNNLDGNSRKDRLRYDTPDFSGFTVSASTYEVSTTKTGAANPSQHDAAFDIALRYSGKFGGVVKLAAAAAYSAYPSTDAADQNDSLLNGSLSVLFSGFSVTVAAGQRDRQNVTAGKADSASSLYGKLGYLGNWFSIGPTALAIDYGKYHEFSGIKDDEATTYALYGVQNLKNWGTELYAGYRIHKLEDRVSTGETFSDIGALFLGMRIKF